MMFILLKEMDQILQYSFVKKGQLNTSLASNLSLIMMSILLKEIDQSLQYNFSIEGQVNDSLALNSPKS